MSSTERELLEYREELRKRYNPILGKYCSISLGWAKLLKPVFEQAFTQNIKIAQTKEKFGTLRIYTEGDSSEELNQRILEAERASSRTCEYCGEPATKDTSGGWVKTLCLDCSEKREAERNNQEKVVRFKSTSAE